MRKEIIGAMLIVIAIAIFLTAMFLKSKYPKESNLFSTKDSLNFIWTNYKKNYIEFDTGRVLDKQADNITTSEGMSYAMLRAVYLDDKESYDKSLLWLNNNLKRKDSSLYSWLFGKRNDGTYGVISERGGVNTASDADIDIALSLVFAYKVWDDEKYLIQAKDIIRDIWNEEVVVINGLPYLASNNLEKFDSEKVLINPSYFAPYAFKIFAQMDQNDWKGLVDSSYLHLNKVTLNNLDTKSSAYLPPDWVTLNKKTGEIIPNRSTSTTTNFSYDALRIPYRITLDYYWYGDKRAKEYLSNLKLLETEWKNNGKLSSVYGHDGKIITESESAALYAGTLGYFMINNKDLAKQIYQNKLLYLYDIDNNDWKQRLGYYDDNWVWFAISLYNESLPNLAQNL